MAALPACMSVPHVARGALGNQKRTSDHLEVESQVAVSGHVSKGN